MKRRILQGLMLPVWIFIFTAIGIVAAVEYAIDGDCSSAKEEARNLFHKIKSGA